jgi:GNAT acetyltransferase-like protein
MTGDGHDDVPLVDSMPILIAGGADEGQQGKRGLAARRAFASPSLGPHFQFRTKRRHRKRESVCARGSRKFARMPETRADQDALAAYVDAAISVDAYGRMPGPTLRLYILRSRESVFCRFHADLDDDVVQRLGALAHQRSPRAREWEFEYGKYIDVLAGAGYRVIAMRAGPLYTFPGDAMAAHDGMVAITQNNEHLLRGLPEWRPEAAKQQPFIAAIVGGQAVAVCASVRKSRYAHAAGVETEPAHRGKGLAAATTAAWATAVRAQGAVPYYGTTFDNLASQGVARRLKLRAVASEFSISCA